SRSKLQLRNSFCTSIVKGLSGCFKYFTAQSRYVSSFPTRRSSDLLPGCTRSCRPRTKTGGSPDTRWGDRRRCRSGLAPCRWRLRSEEHTSELQSRENLVCRLLLEKKYHQ